MAVKENCGGTSKQTFGVNKDIKATILEIPNF
jgi:hypothetical protein